MIDLLAKAKRCPQAFKLLPMGKEASGDGTWAKYYFDDSTSLFVNTSHDEALTWYSEFRQREKNAVNLAQTFVKRNALKHLSGLQKSPTGPNWALKVLCWRPMNDSVIKWDETQYKALQDKVQEFTEGGNGFENAEITSGTENALEDEAFEVLEKDTDPEDSKPDDSGEPDKNTDASREENAALQASSEERKPEPEKPKPRDDLSEMEIIKNSLIMAQESFPEEFAEACTKSKVKPNTLASADPKTMNRDVCETIQKDVNQILDEKEL